MQTRFLLLVPALISIAGCSEKIEAQENDAAASEIGMPPEQEEGTADVSAKQETYLRLRSPVGLD